MSTFGVVLLVVAALIVGGLGAGLVYVATEADRRRLRLIQERLVTEQRIQALTHAALGAMRAEVRRQQRQG